MTVKLVYPLLVSMLSWLYRPDPRPGTMRYSRYGTRSRCSGIRSCSVDTGPDDCHM